MYNQHTAIFLHFKWLVKVSFSGSDTWLSTINPWFNITYIESLRISPRFHNKFWNKIVKWIIDLATAVSFILNYRFVSVVVAWLSVVNPWLDITSIESLRISKVISPWTQDVNWTYIRRSEDVQDVIWTSL